MQITRDILGYSLSLFTKQSHPKILIRIALFYELEFLFYWDQKWTTNGNIWARQDLINLWFLTKHWILFIYCILSITLSKSYNYSTLLFFKTVPNFNGNGWPQKKNSNEDEGKPIMMVLWRSDSDKLWSSNKLPIDEINKDKSQVLIEENELAMELTKEIMRDLAEQRMKDCILL